jgi:type IV fimbrial biogenesis protein FimT
MLDHQEGWRVLSPKHNSTGMSLVELMVAVSIVGILLAAAAPNFSEWIQNTKVRSAADSILNGLSLAKTAAVQRNTDSQFALCPGNASWDVVAQSAAVAAISVCNAAATAGYQRIQTQSVQTSAGNIAIVAQATNGANQTTIGFNRLGRQSSTTDFVNGGIATPVLPVGVDINVGVALAGYSCFCPAGNCGYPAGVAVSATGQLRCLRIRVSSGGQVRMCDPALPAFPLSPQGC